MARNKFDIDETLETPFSLKHLVRASAYILKHKWRMLLALALSALASIASLINPRLTKYAVDVAIPGKDIKMLVIVSVLLLVSMSATIWLNVLRSRIMARVAQTIIYEIRTDLFKHLQYLSFDYYDSRPHGKILVRVVQYVNNVSDILSNGILNFFIDIINIVFIAVFMFLTDVTLSFVIVAGLPFFIGIVVFLTPATRKAWQKVSNKNSNINAYVAESINGMKVTQIFAREELNAGIFRRLSEEYRKVWMMQVYPSNGVWLSVECISILITAAIYLTGIRWMVPAVSYGTLVAMTSYAGRFWGPISNLANIYNSFINSIAYLERIFETIDEPITIHDETNAEELPDIQGRVTFEDVTFAYEKGHNVLEHVSFDVNPGERVALVGPTGAGKSTIVNLISRFYDLTGGRVLIDGHDISKVTIHSLRAQMGIMLQDSIIFSGTIADNLSYGRLDATEEDMKKACDIVRASEFIEAMEDGYHTELYERGGRLSQGQKQLISFARTILSDPRILILDEATSSIDTQTEKMLQIGINNMLKGRTSFIIAHRLSTIKSCDRIMYIADKGIAESGTHDELMAKKGKYYELYMSQLIKK
ncbi:MAG: ABC transporter ATP-binding protein [Clostridia bacterium]|nr:ABC transporter ATP-binding protein [Clostridia bacterium]